MLSPAMQILVQRATTGRASTLAGALLTTSSSGGTDDGSGAAAFGPLTPEVLRLLSAADPDGSQGVSVELVSTSFDPFGDLSESPASSAGMTRLRFSNAATGELVPVGPGLRAPVLFSLPAPPLLGGGGGGASSGERGQCQFLDEGSGQYRREQQSCWQTGALFIAGVAAAACDMIFMSPYRFIVLFSAEARSLLLSTPPVSHVPRSDGCAALPYPQPPGHTLQWVDAASGNWTPAAWTIAGPLASRCERVVLNCSSGGGGAPQGQQQQTVLLDTSRPLDSPLVSCAVGPVAALEQSADDARLLVVFAGSDCQLWREGNAAGCWWSAAAQSFQGPACVPAPQRSLQCACRRLPFSPLRGASGAAQRLLSVSRLAAIRPRPMAEKVRFIAALQASLFASALLCAAAHRARAVSARRATLRRLLKADGGCGFCPNAPAGAWLWGLQPPTAESLDKQQDRRLSGPFAELARTMGVPVHRLRAFIPESLLRGGKGAGALAKPASGRRVVVIARRAGNASSGQRRASGGAVRAGVSARRDSAGSEAFFPSEENSAAGSPAPSSPATVSRRGSAGILRGSSRQRLQPLLRPTADDDATSGAGSPAASPPASGRRGVKSAPSRRGSAASSSAASFTAAAAESDPEPQSLTDGEWVTGTALVFAFLWHSRLLLPAAELADRQRTTSRLFSRLFLETPASDDGSRSFFGGGCTSSKRPAAGVAQGGGDDCAFSYFDALVLRFRALLGGGAMATPGWYRRARLARLWLLARGGFFEPSTDLAEALYASSATSSPPPANEDGNRQQVSPSSAATTPSGGKKVKEQIFALRAAKYVVRGAPPGVVSQQAAGSAGEEGNLLALRPVHSLSAASTAAALAASMPQEVVAAAEASRGTTLPVSPQRLWATLLCRSALRSQAEAHFLVRLPEKEQGSVSALGDCGTTLLDQTEAWLAALAAAHPAVQQALPALTDVADRQRATWEANHEQALSATQQQEEAAAVRSSKGGFAAPLLAAGKRLAAALRRGATLAVLAALGASSRDGGGSPSPLTDQYRAFVLPSTILAILCVGASSEKRAVCVTASPTSTARKGGTDVSRTICPFRFPQARGFITPRAPAAARRRGSCSAAAPTCARTAGASRGIARISSGSSRR